MVAIEELFGEAFTGFQPRCGFRRTENLPAPPGELIDYAQGQRQFRSDHGKVRMNLVALATQIHPDLTVVGPELPLTLGVVDEFTRRGWKTFGPTKAAAKLESSKSFAKEFLNRYHIPTAHYAICTSLDEVRATLPRFHPPVVVKADGLAAGKGVVLAKSKEEAITVSSEMLSGKMLGEAGARVVLEECLQ